MTLERLRVVFERILPDDLHTRGVAGAAGICEALIVEIAASPAASADPGAANADEIFGRLGGD